MDNDRYLSKSCFYYNQQRKQSTLVVERNNVCIEMKGNGKGINGTRLEEVERLLKNNATTNEETELKEGPAAANTAQATIDSV